jgi:methylated-DNA-[protein]-cysteine S-methyltransferase
MPDPSPPELLFIDRVEGPLGTMIVVHDPERRLRALDFDDFELRMRRLLGRHYGTEGVDFRLRRRAAPPPIRRALERYFAGALRAVDAIPVETAGTPFQRAVWRALREIPPGTTLSYGELARSLGRPNAARAVGLANGANPVAIVVPCHRVIGGDMGLVGYAGGIERKRWLLAHEGAAVETAGGETAPARPDIAERADGRGRIATLSGIRPWRPMTRSPDRC